ncbi:MAG: twin-arginine translocase subunit TatB [Rhodobacterales bacterium]|nr:twin-arginine translocase subunit TatB [Rhodobacterales bacterium]
MFDIGWQELFIIAGLAVIVIGPKDLPKAMKTAAFWVRKIRGMAREFQSGVEDMVREAELQELRDQVKDGSSSISEKIEKMVDPTGEMSKDMDLSDVQRDLNDAGREKLRSDWSPAEETLGEADTGEDNVIKAPADPAPAEAAAVPESAPEPKTDPKTGA